MVSQTAEYALRAIVALAQQDGKPMLTPHLADVTRVPPAYLAKVLQTLARSGLVRSKHGLGGGFALAKSPDKITLLNVVNAVDPVQRIHHCPLGIETHGTNLCPLHKRLDEAAALVERSFGETTIAHILSEAGRSTPLCQPADHTANDVPKSANTEVPGRRRHRIQRHPSLVAFSRDHTMALAVAKHLLESAQQEPTARRAAVNEFARAWSENIAAHFDREEELLLPVLQEEPHMQRLRDDHAVIRALARKAESQSKRDEPESEWCRFLGQTLHDHVRWEERELFPSVERTVDESVLRNIGRQTAAGPAARVRRRLKR